MKDIEAVRRYYEAVLPYYDDALEDRGDLPFWESMATRWRSTRILELGCGTGRVTRVLSRVAPVTAIDLLVEMLRCAAQTAPGAHLIAADLRQFALRVPFDLVVLADDPLTHLTSIEDRMRVMRLIAEHLTPDGHVVLEGLYRRAGEPVCVLAREILSDEGGPFTVEESWEATEDASIWRSSYRYTRSTSIIEASSIVRSWSRAEVDHLEEAALRVECVWGDFDEKPFSDSSKRIIVVAGRATNAAKRPAGSDR